MKKIVCFHLLNDYSGSPKALFVVLQDLLDKGFVIDLVTTQGGVLDNLKAQTLVKYTFKYCFSPNKLLTLLRWGAVQVYFFFFTLRYVKCKDIVFYVNTIMPCGAALAAKLMHKQVVYHYHENAFVKGKLYTLLANVMQCIADKIVCVSAYQRSFLKRKKNVFVVPNAIQKLTTLRLKPSFSDFAEKSFERKTVLMLSSLKVYKGVIKFFELAKKLPDFNFTLVVNDTFKNINNFISDNKIIPSANITVYSQQRDIVSFYKSASVVLNLSDSAVCIETFGLTVLEAMTAGLPVIVPEIGGITELVEDGINGYKISVRSLDKIVEQLEKILSDRELYIQLAHGAIQMAKKYDCQHMVASIEKILNE